MNLPPLPEPFYITRSNGRLYEVESGADVTGRVIDAYTQDQLRQAQREAVAAAVPEGYTDDQIAQAAMEAEIPDSKFESILIALHGMTAAALEVKS